MRYRLFLLFLLLSWRPLLAIQFRHMDSKDGLSQLSVMSIHQDKLGRMWFGTEEGVNIFDGNSIISYKTIGSGADNIITDVHAITDDTEGNVYFISNQSIVRYDLAQQTFNFLIKDGVYALRGAGNTLYVGRNNLVLSMNTDGSSQKSVCRLPAGRNVTFVKIDSKGRMWAGSSRGLYCRSRRGALQEIIAGCEVYEVFEDSRHNIWVSTRNNGCFLIKPEGGITNFLAQDRDAWQAFYNFSQAEAMTSTNIAGNMVRGINEDKQGNLWLGTFMGLNKYDYRTGLFTVYAHTNNPYSLSHSSVFPIYRDKNGTMWVGTYFGGVNHFNPDIDLFTFYSADVNRSDCLSYPFVGHMTEDSKGNLWICTEGGGLNRLDRNTGKITHYMRGRGANKIVHNNLKTIVYDPRRNKLYIGTHTGGLTFFDIDSEQFHNVWTLHPEYRARFGDQIFDMHLMGNTLIFTTPQGIWKVNVETDRVEPLFPSGKRYGNSSFHVDHRGYIWIVADTGVYRIKLTNERDLRFYKNGTKGLSPFYVTDINQDSQDNIYLVTRGGGMARYEADRDSFTVMNVENSGLVSNFCYEICPGKDFLLINSDRGISLFNPTNKTIRNIELSPDFPLTGFHRGCGMTVCRDGKVFVGGTNGLVSFYADNIKDIKADYKLYVSRVFVNNKEVFPGDDTGVLSTAAYHTERIDLAHNQNDLSITFASSEYVGNYRSPVYEYMLEGYDDRWVQTTGHRISYTQIVPGTYTLIIREKVRDNEVSQHEVRMKVVVHPPFYKTWFAYFVYLMIFLGVLYYIYRFKRSQILLRTSLEMEKKDKKNIEELNKAKLRFFTSISHEFRTPLTLLITKLDAIIEEITPGSVLYKQFKGLRRHANHLMELINELLDFRKMEQGYTQLEVAEHDMVAFAGAIGEGFSKYAESCNQKFVFTSSEPSIMCWFDARQMEKVFYNLLSNAFKYVEKDKGIVELHVTTDEHHVLIKVMDNGIGIHQDELENIFDRFYQAGGAKSGATSMTGTGIGLALVKEIVERHHGSIRVESSPGYGSVFIVTLPKDKEAFAEKELTDREENVEMPRTMIAESSEVREAEIDTDIDEVIDSPEDAQYTILLVEDNEDLLMSLRKLFAKTCRVLLARDGREGLDLVRKELPDLVVSDVMMPRMSGTEMCKLIKDDIAVSHIPVVLLTAMGSVENTIAGLKCGADDYIPKPFDSKLLVIRCNNLIRSRNLLRKKIREEDRMETELLATTPLDRNFLKRCNEYIEKNLANSEFSIDSMAKELAMGRSSFFNKFKGLTGMTPNDYVQGYRLKLSATWLRQNSDLQISDIAYRLGFSSPRYFSHCFKAKYGVTPKAYRKGS